MKKFLLLNLLLFQNLVLGQGNNPLWNNTEFFIAPTHTWFPKSLTPDLTGKLGFDIGVKKTFKPERNTHFIFGLESNFSNYKFSYYDATNSSHIKYYTDAEISKMAISLSFDFRFHFSSKKRFFIETGPYLDFNVIKQLRGIRHEQSKEDIYVRERVESLPITLGFNLGFGLSFPGNGYDFSIKPDLKWNLWPQMIPEQVTFDNFTYMRLLLIVRKN